MGSESTAGGGRPGGKSQQREKRWQREELAPRRGQLFPGGGLSHAGEVGIGVLGGSGALTLVGRVVCGISKVGRSAFSVPRENLREGGKAVTSGGGKRVFIGGARMSQMIGQAGMLGYEDSKGF